MLMQLAHRFLRLDRSLLLAIATLIATASTAQAATLTRSDGTWINPIGGGAIESRSGSEAQILWGSPIQAGQKSGLGFAGVEATAFDFDRPFLVGTLRHFNNPIFPPNVTAVDLLIRLAFEGIDELPIDRQFTFNFGIDETPNTAPCIYSSTVPCADRIAFTNSFASETFVLGETSYTLKLLGFGSSSIAGSLLSDFISQEQSVSTAYLFGEITVAPSASTPEPSAIAAVGLLGLAIGFWRRTSSIE